MRFTLRRLRYEQTPRSSAALQSDYVRTTLVRAACLAPQRQLRPACHYKPFARFLRRPLLILCLAVAAPTTALSAQPNDAPSTAASCRALLPTNTAATAATIRNRLGARVPRAPAYIVSRPFDAYGHESRLAARLHDPLAPRNVPSSRIAYYPSPWLAESRNVATRRLPGPKLRRPRPWGNP